MGDIAEGLIDGTFDSITGEYLGEGPGYSRSFHEGSDEYMRGKKSSEKGVKNYLSRFKVASKDMYDHCRKFIIDNDLEGTNTVFSWKTVSGKIQDNWEKFVQYTNKKYKRR
jgi:hypothetical protein